MYLSKGNVRDNISKYKKRDTISIKQAIDHLKTPLRPLRLMVTDDADSDDDDD